MAIHPRDPEHQCGAGRQRVGADPELALGRPSWSVDQGTGRYRDTCLDRLSTLPWTGFDQHYSRHVPFSKRPLQFGWIRQLSPAHDHLNRPVRRRGDRIGGCRRGTPIVGPGGRERPDDQGYGRKTPDQRKPRNRQPTSPGRWGRWRGTWQRFSLHGGRHLLEGDRAVAVGRRVSAPESGQLGLQKLIHEVAPFLIRRC